MNPEAESRKAAILGSVKKFFTTHIGYKFFSLAVALVLWVIVVNRQNPIGTVTVTGIPITIQNENYFTEHGKYVEFDENITVAVTVSGQRSVVENLSADDFTATIDYLNVVPEEGKAEILCTCSNRSVTIKQQNITYAPIFVEDLISREYSLQLVMEGAPAEGYMVPEEDPMVVMVPSTVTLKGPQSRIDQIAAAKVSVNLEQATSDVTGKGKNIVFLDAEGNEINLDGAEGITFSAKLMSQLTVPVYKYKTVSVGTPDITENAAGDYYVSAVSISDSEMRIYGPAEVVDAISEVKLSLITVTGEKEVFTKEYDLTAVVASLSSMHNAVIGLADDGVQKITVTVEQRPYTVKSYSIPLDNITVTGLAETYSCTLADGSLQVTVKGKPDAYPAGGSVPVKVSMDLSQVSSTGEYVVNVVYKLADGLTTVSAPDSVTVTITETEAEETTDG